MKFLKLFLVLCLGFASPAFSATCFDTPKPYDLEGRCTDLWRQSVNDTHDLAFRINKLLNVVKNNRHYHRVAPQVQELNVRTYTLLRQLNTLNCCVSTRDDVRYALHSLERQHIITAAAIDYVFARHPSVDVQLHSERVEKAFRQTQRSVQRYVLLEE